MLISDDFINLQPFFPPQKTHEFTISNHNSQMKNKWKKKAIYLFSRVGQVCQFICNILF